MHIAKSSPKRG